MVKSKAPRKQLATKAARKAGGKAPRKQLATRRSGGKPPRKLRLIFMGNPGAGKSTLLNSFLGRYYFQSGVTAGEGLTQLTKEFIIKSQGREVTLVDTPGLSEYGKKRQMADEIARANKPGVKSILVFVCTMPEGRIDNEFIKTVQIIMKSFPVQHPFHVIFNKYGPLVENSKEAIQRRHGTIFETLGLCRPTVSWVPMHQESYGMDAALLPQDASVYQQIVSRTGTVTNGLRIHLEKAHQQWVILDDAYEDPIKAFKGEEGLLPADFVPFEHNSCPMNERLRFNESKKAHCKHCSWFKVMTRRVKQRRAVQHPCVEGDPNCEPCLYCHNS